MHPPSGRPVAAATPNAPDLASADSLDLVGKADFNSHILKSASRAAMLTAVSKWLDIIGTTATFLVTVRLLGPESFGIFGMALLATLLPETVIGGALGESLIQRRDLRSGHIAGAFVLHLVLSVALLAVVVALSPWFATHFQAPELRLIIPALAITFLMLGAAAVPVSLLQRDLRYATITRVNVAGMLAAAVVGAGCALAGFGVWTLVFMEISRRTVRSVGFILGAKWRPTFTFTGADLSDLLHFNLTTLGSRLLSQGELAIPRFMVGTLMGPLALGHFNLAVRMFQQTAELLMAPFHAVALPVASAMQGDRQQLRVMLTAATRAATLLAYPVFLGMAAVTPVAIPLIFGADWSASIPVVQIVLICGLAIPTCALNGNLLRGCGRPELETALGAFGLVTGIALVPLAAPWGLVPMAAMMVAQSVITSLLGSFLAARIVGHSVRRQLSTGWESLAAALLMAIVVMSANEALKGMIQGAPLLVFLILTGAAVHAGALALLAPALFRSIWTGVRTRAARHCQPISKIFAN